MQISAAVLLMWREVYSDRCTAGSMKVRIFKELTIDWDWLGHNVMARDLCKECNYT